jgi:hypothetical protein
MSLRATNAASAPIDDGAIRISSHLPIPRFVRQQKAATDKFGRRSHQQIYIVINSSHVGHAAESPLTRHSGQGYRHNITSLEPRDARTALPPFPVTDPPTISRPESLKPFRRPNPCRPSFRADRHRGYRVSWSDPRLCRNLSPWVSDRPLLAVSSIFAIAFSLRRADKLDPFAHFQTYRQDVTP